MGASSQKRSFTDVPSTPLLYLVAANWRHSCRPCERRADAFPDNRIVHYSTRCAAGLHGHRVGLPRCSASGLCEHDEVSGSVTWFESGSIPTPLRDVEELPPIATREVESCCSISLLDARCKMRDCSPDELHRHDCSGSLSMYSVLMQRSHNSILSAAG